MSTPAAASFGRKFDLDAGTGILTNDSAGSVEVGLASDADVVQAILTNVPLPSRPGGRIELGRIQVSADAGKDIAFNGGGTKVVFRGSASVNAGIGIYDAGADAVTALDLDPTLGLVLSGGEERFAVLRWGYQVEGAVSGTHPLGALGSLTFGVEASREALYAVIHRFPATQGAHDVFRNTFRSWLLPRQVEQANQLAPGTWIIAEAEGHIAMKLAAQLGYDFSFVHELKAAGLSGDVGMKIDAAARATIGFEVSGRYVLALGREDNSQTLRLRLFKLSKKGHSFGLNLNVGVQGITDALPDQADDFVKAVFGVHGRQVLKDLLLVEQWTDPTKDLSDTVAALVNKTGLELLKRVTGIDPADAFNDARERLLGQLRLWDRLPDQYAAATWKALEQSSGNDAALSAFRTVVQALAEPDEKKRAKKLAQFIGEAAAPVLPDMPVVGRIRAEWLAAIANRGLLSLTGQLEEVHQASLIINQILDGGVIGKLQSFIGERLNLNLPDFAQVDEWLVRRLSQYLDEEVKIEKLSEIRTLINTVVKKRHEVYSAAKKAIEQRYSAELAATYAKTTADAALIDVEFDLTETNAQALLHEVLAEGKLDELLSTPVPGATLHTAVLSHGINRASSVEVNLPYYSFRQDHINETLASVSAHDDGERVLLYRVDASDTVTVRNKLRSQLAVSAAFPGAPQGSNLRVRSTSGTSWSYQFVAAQDGMRRADVESRIAPFLARYMPDQFAQGGQASLDTWLTDLDRVVEDVLHNGSNEFGDTILDMQVSVPGKALGAWFQQRSDSRLKQDANEMSRRIQAGLRQYLPFYYLRDPDRLRQNSTVAALLTWSALPVSTSVRLTGNQLALDTGDSPFWDHVNPQLRRAMAGSSRTASMLAPMLAASRKILLEAGQSSQARFFEPAETADFQSLALTGPGETLLSHLLMFEARVIEQAVEALGDVRGFLADAGSAPSKAVERLAELGADITDAFHGKLSTVYGGDAVRSLGSLVFLEATCALDPSLRSTRPDALLRLMVLKKPRAYAITDYLKGIEPPPDAIAVAQTLAAIA